MSHENVYDIGDVVRMSVAFTDAGGAAVDPGAVVFKLLDPAGVVTTFSGGGVVKDSVGNYHADATIAASGVHVYRAEGTGANAAAAENRFRVRRSRVLEAA
ncbi:MAG: hypothetical protein ACE5GS_17445 [Kiloniellaceae bacterium]